MDKKKIEGIKSSQEFPQQFGKPPQKEFQARPTDYHIWANLANMRFEKTVYYYKVKLSAVDEEKAEFTITMEKDYNLRQKVLNAFNIYQKLNDMFVGRYVYSDTLVKVIQTEPDKSWETVYSHEGENYNLELSIELQGEKTDAKSILNYVRDILTIFQKNVIKYKRYGKQCYFNPASRETIRGAESIDVVTGVDMNVSLYKPATMKINIDYKVATIFNRDVTHFLKEKFQKYDAVTYDQLLTYLKERKFTDGDNRLYLDDLTPKKESYTPFEVMNLNATMYKTLRNMRFKRDPTVVRLQNLTFTVENKDVHSNDAVKMATKRKQMRDFQFYAFCNTTLNSLREHWMFKENGIVFQDNFNIIPIERQLQCQIELGGGEVVSTHDTEGNYDKNYNNAYKNISSKVLKLAKNSIDRWIILYEQAPGLKEKIQAMIDKMQKSLARVYGISIANPNVVEVRDVAQYNWAVSEAEIVVVIINSRAKQQDITRKYEVVKYQCHKNGGVANQVILSKTFEQGDFLRLVMLNVMYDLVMKLPNTVGHRVLFDTEMTRWMAGSTMVFAMDVCHRKGSKSVAAILSYNSTDMTVFRTEYIVKDDEYSELKYSDETKLKFKEIIKRCILDWEYHNGSAPVSRVVFFRDGINDSQRRFVENTEIAYINEVFAELSRDRIQLWFLTANKRISTKIFEWSARDNKLNHLEAGVYVAKDIVKDALPSFYLNSSNNRLSKCCFYECLYPKQVENQTDFDNLTALVFKLSFVYYHAYNLANISVPGILKYAEKKANFYSIIHSLKNDEEEGKAMFDDSKSDALKRKRDY